MRGIASRIGEVDVGEFASSPKPKSIFRKLDVAARPDAVSRARELRLL